MDIQPNPNSTGSKGEISERSRPVGGDHIVIHGDVGVGASVGRGSVTANYIVGGDATHNNYLEDGKTEFSNLMLQLRDLIVQSYKSGEITERAARKAIGSLADTAELVSKEDSPPKKQILGKLQYVADILDTAVDMFSSSGGVASVLLKALPVAALLIKIATRIF